MIHKEVKSEKQLLSPIEYVQIKNFFPPVNNFNLDIDNSELIRFAKDMFKNEENKFENKNFGLNFLTLLEELDPNVLNDEEDVWISTLISEFNNEMNTDYQFSINPKNKDYQDILVWIDWSKLKCLIMNMIALSIFEEEIDYRVSFNVIHFDKL